MLNSKQLEYLYYLFIQTQLENAIETANTVHIEHL